MRSRIPPSPTRASREDAHYNDDLSDSDSGLLSQKPNDSAQAYNHRPRFSVPTWAQEYQSSFRLPTWAQKYSASAGLPERLKHVASLSARVSRRTIGLLSIISLVTLIGWMALQRPPESTSTPIHRSSWLDSAKAAYRPPSDAATAGDWAKPAGFQIVGIVFYGRRVHVDILDCYLQQNLARNGGYLDGVIFFQNTDDSDDIDYLTALLEREPRYKRIDVGADVRHWKHMWDAYFDDSTMYFKIDDDLVYIHPDAIPQMVHTLMEHPEAHNIQANIVNSASTSWQHFHAGAVRAYLPELVPPRPWVVNWTTWRPSELPTYPAEFARDKFDLEEAPPFNGHRWLPLEDSSVALMKTPIQQTENYAWGRDWTKWGIAAQHHYSLFNNIEERTMDRYIFGNGEGIYNTQYERYKINLMAIWGSTINAARPQEDDERELTEEIPKRLGMPVLVQTKAIAAHFSFEPQRGVYQTDLLLRYMAYANECVCAPNNQKKQFPDWQKTLEKWGV